MQPLAPPLSRTMRERLRRAAAALGADARRDLLQFLRSRRCPDGGYQGRDARSDLYYTSFVLPALEALGEADHTAPLQEFLTSCSHRPAPTLIDRICLLRSLALCAPGHPAIAALAERLEDYRCADGGYAPAPAAQQGTAYAPYLILLAYEDAGHNAPAPERISSSLRGLQLSGGGFGNDPQMTAASTPATAAALLSDLRCAATCDHDGAIGFLRSMCAGNGGFFATPGAPVPDLLSTATALHALREAEADLHGIRAACLQFVESCWQDDGGFRAHALDPVTDGEYTFYGLLALGNLLL